MYLDGWKYTGRALNKDTQDLFINMAKAIRDEPYISNSVWNNELQEKIGQTIGIKTSGQIRTLKSLMEKLGFIKEKSFNNKNAPNFNNDFSDDFKVLVYLDEILNYRIQDSLIITSEEEKIIKEIIDLIYTKNAFNLKNFNKNNEYFNPNFIIYKALLEFEYMDKIEWYMLNTFVDNNDSEKQWNEFKDNITKYRSGKINKNMIEINPNNLSQSYILNSLVNIGFLTKYKNDEDDRYKLNMKYKDLVDEFDLEV
ncbi:hypothetical protein B8A33_05160 [Dolosigranulum pigrum]|uniref:hypothetical protein n=1 Tax=Dolosigranulum pigrum TaxID=29394 RepID=UPI000DBFFB82|nr:hypothetical protein [Dolosigranulum pigrum]RAN56429.1 hypothetical protein B8A33_05160 [Dolosigranulum pigrum]